MFVLITLSIVCRKIHKNLDFSVWNFSVQFSVYIVCSSVFSLNNLELHKNKLTKRFFYTKIKTILLFILD